MQWLFLFIRRSYRTEGPSFKGLHADYITIYQRQGLKAKQKNDNNEHHYVDMFTKVVEKRWVKSTLYKHLRLCSPLRSGLCRRSPPNPMLCFRYQEVVPAPAARRGIETDGTKRQSCTQRKYACLSSVHCQLTHICHGARKSFRGASRQRRSQDGRRPTINLIISLF